MEEAILQVAEVIQQNNDKFNWPPVISAICSIISLITIVLLLLERFERKRPYLQVSFELLKSSLVCIVIRNVGETPAILNQIMLDEDFVQQLPTVGQENVKDRDALNISIYPKQQWVLCLDVITQDVLKYQNTKLNIQIKYSSKRYFKKQYIDSETIDFNDYSGFLVYISEIDELRNEVRSLVQALMNTNRTLSKYLGQINTIRTETQTYADLSDSHMKTVVTGKGTPIILERQGEGSHE